MKELIRQILHEETERLMWDYERTKKLAKTVNSRAELKYKNQSAYQNARINGWLDEFFPPKTDEEKQKELIRKIEQEAKKHSTRGEFHKESPSLYNKARELKILDRLIKLPEKRYNQSSTQDFINKAIKIFSDRYDYSNVDYKNSHTKIIVNCKKHGPFPISPSNHLGGKGCPVCANISRGNSHRSNKEDFVLKAKKIFGDEYDYSLVDYETNFKPVSIVCPKHGPFQKSPQNHLKGQGCPECTEDSNYRGSSQRFSQEDFIKKAKEIHGNKFDYSKVNYVNSIKPVKIICPIHGEFPQQPASHLSGAGCPKCAGFKKTTDEFISQSKKIHGDRYDYSKVEYKNAKTRVNIICPKHGDFFPTPNQHLGGQGCPVCNESKGERLIDNLLNQHKIEKVRQKRFLDCTNKPKKGVQCVTLPFDFYLPNLNTIIEFDGQQHYKPVWGEENLKRLQRLDKIRNQYCEKKGIKLIRIPYTMSPEEIETYLLMELDITD